MKSSAFIFLTRACNLTCSHCYVSASPLNKVFMRNDVFFEVVSKLIENKIFDMRLTGGEPTLHPEIEMILRYLNKNNVQPRLITNGVKIIRDKDFYHSVLESVSQCWLSVYGVTEEQHHAIGGRGNNGLAKILEFAGKKPGTDCEFGISALLTNLDVVEARNFLEIAMDFNVKNLRFIFSEPSGRAKNLKSNYSFKKHEQNLERELVDICEKYSKQGAFQYLAVNNPFNFEGIDSPVASTSSCLLHNRNMWSISPEGDLYSCCFNIYNTKHYISNFLESGCGDSLESNMGGKEFSANCEALSPRFWGSDAIIPTCPISLKSFSNKISE